MTRKGRCRAAFRIWSGPTPVAARAGAGHPVAGALRRRRRGHRQRLRGFSGAPGALGAARPRRHRRVGLPARADHRPAPRSGGGLPRLRAIGRREAGRLRRRVPGPEARPLCRPLPRCQNRATTPNQKLALNVIAHLLTPLCALRHVCSGAMSGAILVEEREVVGKVIPTRLLWEEELLPPLQAGMAYDNCH